MYCWTEVNILTFPACLKPKMHTKKKYVIIELIFIFLNRLFLIKYIFDFLIRYLR